MHKGKPLEAYSVWKRVRGIESPESREEFYVMMATVQEEETEGAESPQHRTLPMLDFFTYVLILVNDPVSPPLLQRDAGSLDCLHPSFLVFPEPVAPLSTQI